MTAQEKSILQTLNELIREEHGNRVTLESRWIDANVDSFGATVVFLNLDSKYECFDNNWFEGISVEKWNKLTIREIVERVINESPKL